MSIIEDMRVQDAVYWESNGKNESGDYSFELPIDITVRWQDGITILNIDGNDVVYNGTVYVDRAMPVGSRLLKDTVIEELDAPLPPPDEARPVKRLQEIPDIDAEEILYKALI